MVDRPIDKDYLYYEHILKRQIVFHLLCTHMLRNCSEIHTINFQIEDYISCKKTKMMLSNATTYRKTEPWMIFGLWYFNKKKWLFVIVLQDQFLPYLFILKYLNCNVLCHFHLQHIHLFCSLWIVFYGFYNWWKPPK